MAKEKNVFKLYKALQLKEWGWRTEADDLITEIIFEEVEDNDVSKKPQKEEETKNVRYYDKRPYERSFYW